MSRRWSHRLLVSGAAVSVAIASVAVTSSQGRQPWGGVLEEHPEVRYASRPTTDRVAKLNQSLAERGRSIQRDARTGYLVPVLEALGVPKSEASYFGKLDVTLLGENRISVKALGEVSTAYSLPSDRVTTIMFQLENI